MPKAMRARAMLLREQGRPLELAEIEVPMPGPGQLLLAVRACGICRTDLHILDGDLDSPKLPLVLGHEIVGEVVRIGQQVAGFKKGDRVGVPWMGSTCGTCRFCRAQRENLCDHAGFTGYQLDGGFAEYVNADLRFCFRIPDAFKDTTAAPLLCAGLIGHRSLRMAGSGRRLGLYGFGAAAHIIAQVAAYQGREVYAFTRKGDQDGQAFARRLGAVWAGDSETAPPQELDAAIIFAPVGSLVPTALRAVVRGGTVVCAGIHMSEIPALPYDILWGERTLRSVANLTRQDGEEFLALAAQVPVRTHVEEFPLAQANEAIQRLREGKVKGAAVLVVGQGNQGQVELD